MKNIILVDFTLSGEWEFHRAVEQSSGKKWIVKSVVSNQHGSMWLKLLRYIKYFSVPFSIFVNRKRYSSILAWQQFYGIILAFYMRLFKVKNAPQITVMTFIYKPKKGLVGKLYASFMNYVVKSEYITRFIVFSESEKEYYAKLFDISADKFVSEKLGIEDLVNKYDVTQGEYYVAAGRSNRDYQFLRDSWSKKNPILKIICDTCKGTNTENIFYNKQCHNEEYFRELAGCNVAIVPLEDERISSGQLVFLQAMMFGKPVIVTDNETVYNYVQNGVNGIIIDKSKKCLEDALKLLNEKTYYEKVSKDAREIFEKEYTIYAMGLRIGSYL